jgi:hypothetical protein
MPQLTSQNGIKVHFQQLRQDQLKSLFSLRTYFKGAAYFHENRVENLEIISINQIEAVVEGNSKYRVNLILENSELLSTCTCPVGLDCKHIVAAMIYAKNHVEELEDVKDQNQKDKFSNYIESLSKNELVSLLMKYVPQSFRQEIENSYLEIDQAKKLFDRTAKKIKNLFDNEELLYEPSDFDGQLTELFGKLKGIWDKFPKETSDLIIDIIRQIGKVLDDGLLYNNYYDDMYEGEEFLNLIQQFTYGLPLDAKMKFVDSFQKVIMGMNYDVFGYFLIEKEKIFTESDKPFLKDYFLQKLLRDDLQDAEGYFRFLKNLILPDEIELVLEKIYHLSAPLSLELVELYTNQSKPGKAVLLLEGILEANPDYRIDTENLYRKLLQLKMENRQPIEKDAFAALNKHDSVSLLELIVSYLPDKKEPFEKVLKSKNSNRYLEYLEKHNRIPEALQLVLESNTLMDSSVYNFYIHHLKSCPVEAKAYFIDRINKELPYTGDSHYEIIRNSLVYLKQIDKNKTSAIVAMIRVEYKRRRNLMALLSDF